MGDRGMVGNMSQPASTRFDASQAPNRGMGKFTPRSKAKPVHAPYVLEESYKDHRQPELQAKLYEESVGFENLANDPFVVEQARSAVQAGVKDTFNVLEFLRNKWLILYRLYRGETLAEFTYGRTQLHSPEPFKTVETIHPRIMRSMFGPERWYRMHGERDGDDHSAKMQEALTRDQFRAMNYRQKASNFVRAGLIFGTAIQKLYWRQEVKDMKYRVGRRVPDEKRQGGSRVELEGVEREELVFDGNWVDQVEIFDFYTAPNSTSVEDAEWAMDRSAWPDYKVKEMGELGHWLNLEALKDHHGTNDVTFGDEFKERKSYAYGVFDPREGSWAPHVPHYHVFDWWGPLVIKNQNGNYTTKLCNVVMLEPDSLNLIVRVTECPFWHQQKPYQAWRPISLENEFYGIGVLEMIARLSLEKDMKRNLLMAATQLEANPMWMISDQANIPDGQLILQPGLTLRVPDVSNAIAPLHVPQVSDAALKAENVLTKDLRETSGATSPQMGAQDPFGRGKTATQHSSEVDESNVRLIGMIENLEQGVIIPMLDQMSWNNQQFMSYERVVRELGQVGLSFMDRYTIRPEDLIGRFLVQPLVSSRLVTKQTMVQQLVNLLDRAPVINQTHPGSVNSPKLLAMILEQGFDIRNVDDFIQLPPEETGLLTAMEEHELWYHGNVPPRRADDNDMRHILGHMQEIKGERFKELSDEDAGTAARARAHLADHMRKLALQQEQQERMQMLMAQQQGMMGQGGGGSPLAGAAGPDQEPGSPQVRRNENERGEGGDTQSKANQEAPNPGAA